MREEETAREYEVDRRKRWKRRSKKKVGTDRRLKMREARKKEQATERDDTERARAREIKDEWRKPSGRGFA